MRLRKLLATITAAAMVVGIMMTPAAGLQAEAVGNGRAAVYTNNQATGIPSVTIQTPKETTKLYAGLSWEAMEQDLGVRLNVTDSECGPAARNSLLSTAMLLGAREVKTLDMDLEKYVKNSGWSTDIPETTGRIRVCIGLPAGSDGTKDYAVLCLKQKGAVEVLGDLDLNPATITVDSDYFDTFMIVAAPAGTFNAYRVANPNALDEMECPVYVKYIDSTIYVADRKVNCNVYSLGMLTDAGTVWAAAGGKQVSLYLEDVVPGPQARKSLDETINLTNAMNKIRTVVKEEKGEKKEYTERYDYFEMGLKDGAGARVKETNGKLRITVTIPYNFPVYADYAVAVLNRDGTVSIMKDIDENPSTITVDTDQFRACVFLWGKKGAFDTPLY